MLDMDQRSFNWDTPQSKPLKPGERHPEPLLDTAEAMQRTLGLFQQRLYIDQKLIDRETEDFYSS